MNRARMIGVIGMILLLSGCVAKTQIRFTRALEQQDELKESFLEMTVDQVETRKSVEPESPSGYYHYYPETVGYDYICVEGSVKNTAAETMDVSNMEVKLSSQGDSYDGKMMLYNEDGTDLSSEIRAQQELKYVIFFQIETGKAETKGRLTLHYEEMLRKRISGDEPTYETVWELN